MSDATTIRREEFDNGLVVEFVDQSNRYFGDYHRVRIQVRVRLALEEGLFQGADDPAAELARARTRFGLELVETRHLERMGVPGAEVEAVRAALIDGFLRTGASYLQRSDYPLRLLRQRLTAPAKPPFLNLLDR